MQPMIIFKHQQEKVILDLAWPNIISKCAYYLWIGCDHISWSSSANQVCSAVTDVAKFSDLFHVIWIISMTTEQILSAEEDYELLTSMTNMAFPCLLLWCILWLTEYQLHLSQLRRPALFFWNHSGWSEQAALFHSSPTIIQLWLILSSVSPHLPVCICLQEEWGMDLQSLNIESLEQLKYTSCVIKETLRINPPVPGGFRVALKTFELNVS